MGKKGKDKKKGKGAEKTAAKTEKKLHNKLKKDIEAIGEDDIETIVAKLEKEEKARLKAVESIIEKPSRRINFTFVPHPDRDELILFGGEFFNGQKTDVFNDLIFYNIPNDRWTLVKAPNGPAPRCGHQMVVTSANGGQLWLFGGEFSSSSQSQFHHYRDLWVYHLSEKKWTKMTTSGGPSSRSGHRMVIVKNKIFMFGGFHDNLIDYKYFNDVYCFDITSYEWTKVEATGRAPAPRSGCCMTALPDGKILIYGGYSKTKVKKDVDKGQVYSDAYILSLDKNDKSGTKYKWISTKIGGISFSPRCSMPMSAPFGTKSYCFGGVFDKEEDEEEISGSFYNELLSLDLEKLMWWTVTVTGKKEVKTRRRKQKGEGDENEESSDSSEEIDTITEAVETTTVADDGIFKVTVGPAPVSSQTTSSGNNGKSSKLFHPSPRMNCGLAIRRGVLYLYGGMVEEDDKEITYNDFYALDLHKLEEWKVIIPDDKPQAEWLGSGSESEGESGDESSMEDDDEDGDDEDGDDEDGDEKEGEKVREGKGEKVGEEKEGDESPMECD